MIYAVTMVRDESDIIGYTLPRMAAQVDGVIVADNLSSPEHRDYLSELCRPFTNVMLVDDPEPGYVQSLKMSYLARLAGGAGATVVVPFDADEVWVSPSGQLRSVLADAGCEVSEALLYDHVVTGKDDLDEPDPTKRIGWRRDYPLPLPKVACRVLPGLVIEQGNHGAHYPGRVHQCASDIVVHHYPYRSADQHIRKVRNGAAAYRAAEGRTPPGAGQHWIEHDRFTDEQIAEVFTTWFYSPDAEGLVWDPPQ